MHTVKLAVKVLELFSISGIYLSSYTLYIADRHTATRFGRTRGCGHVLGTPCILKYFKEMKSLNICYLTQFSSTGNVNLSYDFISDLITESSWQEISDVISFQKASDRICLMLSHYKKLLKWNSISHVISLQKAPDGKYLMISHYRKLLTANFSYNAITQSS